MPFVLPKYSKSQVNRAGDILADPRGRALEEWEWAGKVLANWRACHAYPINTFQALLRQKLKSIDRSAIVAQRLKRAPSIVLKLQRFEGMQLARMQDIGGLRAVVDSIPRVRRLEEAYRSARFKHELVGSKDYIAEPKEDGYRSIHLIYRYSNARAPAYNGLCLELQIRTHLQHAWATAVETMGTFLGQALKSGRGEEAWRRFFTGAGAAFAVLESSAPVPGFEGRSRDGVFAEVAAAEKDLHVLDMLQGFAIAARQTTTEPGRGAYHLITLDFGRRAVQIRPYAATQLEQASVDYAAVEERARGGEKVDAVLVSAGPIGALRKAYPNYFLDTQKFVQYIRRVMAEA